MKLYYLHKKKNRDKLIVKSETTWCLLDATSKKPKRISPEIAKVFR